MGFQTTVIINNDHLNLIKKDPNFGLSLAEAVCKASIRTNTEIPVRSSVIGSGSATVAYVIESHHCDRKVNLCATNLGATIIKDE